MGMPLLGSAWSFPNRVPCQLSTGTQQYRNNMGHTSLVAVHRSLYLCTITCQKVSATEQQNDRSGIEMRVQRFRPVRACNDLPLVHVVMRPSRRNWLRC